MQTKKNNTPSCIKNYVNKININCIHISIFADAKKTKLLMSSLNIMLSKQEQKSNLVDYNLIL